MSDTSPDHDASAKALDTMIRTLGKPTETLYGSGRLTLNYDDWTKQDLAALLEGVGSRIEANLTLPARDPAHLEEHVMGSLDNVHFTARTSVTVAHGRRLEIHLYNQTGRGENDRLLPVFAMVDTLFAAAGEPDAMLISYLGRQLQVEDPERAKAISANVSITLSDYLTSLLPVKGGTSLRELGSRRRT